MSSFLLSWAMRAIFFSRFIRAVLGILLFSSYEFPVGGYNCCVEEQGCLGLGLGIKVM